MGPGFESLKVHQAPRWRWRLLELTTDDYSVSADNVQGPPVPIPNTVVKLYGAYDTRLATARDNWCVLTLRSLRVITHVHDVGLLVLLTYRVHPFPFRTR